MTGRGMGFCVLALPAQPNEPPAGLTGRAGRWVGRPLEGEAELARLRRQARQIETVLHTIRGRIKLLQARRRQPVGV